MTRGRKPKYDNTVIGTLQVKGAMRAAQIAKTIRVPYSQVTSILKRLVENGLLVKHGKTYNVAAHDWKLAAVTSSNTPINSPTPVENSNQTIDALKAELEYIRTTVNNLVQAGEYIKTRIKELSE